MNYFDVYKERKQFISLCRGHKYISLVGAGGKTTTIFYLGNTFAEKDERVLIATTTKMMEPVNMAENIHRVDDLWNKGVPAVIGKRFPEVKKIGFPEWDFFREAAFDADHVLIEADGSKRYPAKAPRENEPVILPETSLVICVMGMNSIGRPMDEVCFGLKEAQQILDQKIPEGNGKQDEDSKSDSVVFTEEAAAEILSSVNGGRKCTEGKEFAVLLNQCDTRERVTSAEKIRTILEKKNIKVFLQYYSAEEQGNVNR